MGEVVIYDEVRRREELYRDMMPVHMRANSPAFVAGVMVHMRANPALARCSRESILGGIYTAAQIGLQFGPLGHCYLVPFKGRAQFVLGYQGVKELAFRSEKIKAVGGSTVRADDVFDYSLGTDAYINHVPSIGTLSPAIGYYAYAVLAADTSVVEVMGKDRVEEYRQRSASAKASHSPWVSDYNAMAVKTCFLRLKSWLPLSPEVAEALSYDGTVREASDPGEIATEYIEGEEIEG